MKTVGFITSETSPGLYRGMDAYAGYLLPPMQKLSSKFDLTVEPVILSHAVNSPQLDLYHFPTFSFYYPSIPFIFPKPYVVTVHDATRLEFPDKYPSGIRGRFKLEYQKIILNKSRYVITDSYSSVIQIRRYLGIDHHKIRMIHLAADDIFKPVKNNLQLREVARKYLLPPKFILTNGDIDWNKNLLNLAKVCNQLKIPLVVYGKSPRELLDYPEKYNFHHPELSHLALLRQELSSEFIHLLGFIPDSELVLVFNLAALYCQPAFAEGFGIPILQAMVCEVPVVCSRSHSLPEIAGEAALYFDPYNIDSISTSLLRCLDHRSFASQLVKMGKIQARKYSWDQTAEYTLGVYQEVLIK